MVLLWTSWPATTTNAGWCVDTRATADGVAWWQGDMGMVVCMCMSCRNIAGLGQACSPHPATAPHLLTAVALRLAGLPPTAYGAGGGLVGWAAGREGAGQ